MPKSLVIVESPTKAKTINKYLGKDYTVEASLGHIKDLPKSKLGVDIEGDFSAEYNVIPGQEKVVPKLKTLAKSAPAIYLAPDPDRTGVERHGRLPRDRCLDVQSSSAGCGRG